MPMSYPGYVRSPHVAYVDFKIAGQSITKVEGKPYSFQRFSFTRQVAEAAEFELELFDPNWSEIEALCVEHPDKVSFTFGYEPPVPDIGQNSEVWTGQLTAVIPRFAIDGIYLTVRGLSNIADANMIKKAQSWPDSRVHGPDNFKRISEYVEEIAKKRGWLTADKNGPTVDKTKEIKVADSFAGTELVNMRFVQQRTTDLQFIRNILKPHAVREKDNVAGYQVYLVEEEGKQILHFHPPRRENAVSRTFVYMRDKNSEVLNFEVDHDGALFMSIKGGEAVAIPVIDMLNGEEKHVVIEDKNTPEKTKLAGATVKPPKPLVFKTIHAYPFITTLPAQNEIVAEAMAREKYFTAFNTPVNAKLTIQGDDRDDIDPEKVIRVLVQTNSGALHYTSGNYLVISKTDEITNGTWTTTLQLTREGTPRSEKQISGRDNTGGGAS